MDNLDDQAGCNYEQALSKPFKHVAVLSTVSRLDDLERAVEMQRKQLKVQGEQIKTLDDTVDDWETGSEADSDDLCTAEILV